MIAISIESDVALWIIHVEVHDKYFSALQPYDKKH